MLLCISAFLLSGFRFVNQVLKESLTGKVYPFMSIPKSLLLVLTLLCKSQDVLDFFGLGLSFAHRYGNAGFYSSSNRSPANEAKDFTRPLRLLYLHRFSFQARGDLYSAVRIPICIFGQWWSLFVREQGPQSRYGSEEI